MAISLDLQAGARGIYIVRGACEDVHNDSAFSTMNKRPAETWTPSPGGEGLSPQARLETLLLDTDAGLS